MIQPRARAIVALIAASIGAGGCGPAEPATGSVVEEVSVRYVALGDSYTIGTSVAEADRWPNQLVARVPELEIVGNLAVNGYTSADLIRDELPALAELRPEFVTVLIGVNDVVQGLGESAYAGNVAAILDELLAQLPADRVLCVATPDYTVTPNGASYGDPAQQSAAIVRTNGALREACDVRGIAFVGEIFEVSRGARDDLSLVAEDGLHPSGVQYERWVDAIEPAVRQLLGH